MAALSEAQLSFQNRLARLLAAVGEPRLWPTLAAFLREDIAFDSWVTMIFYKDAAPLLIYEGDNDLKEDPLFPLYIETFYRLDPFYLFSCDKAPPGLYRLSEVAPEHFRHTEYFRKYFVHNVGEDEVQLLYPLPSRGVLSFSLGRHSPFPREEIERLYLYSPWLLALLERNIHILEHTGRDTVPGGRYPKSRKYVHETTIAGFVNLLQVNPSWDLTDREIEAASLILSGDSAKTIAKKLGISPETVKVHKRNLYRKLKITGQSELFRRFLESSHERDNDTASRTPL